MPAAKNMADHISTSLVLRSYTCVSIGRRCPVVKLRRRRPYSAATSLKFTRLGKPMPPARMSALITGYMAWLPPSRVLSAIPSGRVVNPALQNADMEWKTAKNTRCDVSPPKPSGSVR